MTGRPQQPVATLTADPGAVIYAEGWQSWSVVAPMPAAAAPHRVTAPESLIIDCQGGVAAPPGVHEGSGLLAVQPGTATGELLRDLTLDPDRNHQPTGKPRRPHGPRKKTP